MAEKLDKQKQIKDVFENRVDVEYIPPKAKQQEGEDEHRILRVAPYCRVVVDTDGRAISS